jgi:hypothetical protein
MKIVESESGGVSPMEEEKDEEMVIVEEALTSYIKRPTDLYNFRNVKNPHLGMFLAKSFYLF